MTTITFRQPAPRESRFTLGCFDAWIGRQVPFRIMDRWVGDCRVVSAELADDGSAVTLTVDIPDDAAPQAPIPPRSLRLPGDER